MQRSRIQEAPKKKKGTRIGLELDVMSLRNMEADGRVTLLYLGVFLVSSSEQLHHDNVRFGHF